MVADRGMCSRLSLFFTDYTLNALDKNDFIPRVALRIIYPILIIPFEMCTEKENEKQTAYVIHLKINPKETINYCMVNEA